jgi:glyoxylase-like metal-dependent hydrolase (beta-lactamase superfamily II)
MPCDTGSAVWEDGEARMTIRFCDEFDGGFGWIVDDEFFKRCSHTLVVDGHVWVIDPVDGEGVEERIRSAGELTGIFQLVNRHRRGSLALAERLGAPVHVLPNEPIAGAPFEFRSVCNLRGWQEVGIWWPERRVLVVGDSLGTARYFRAGNERLAVHPLLRGGNPPGRRLGDLDPQVVLCGHGEGVLADAGTAFQEALSTARRRIPRLLASWVGLRGR